MPRPISRRCSGRVARCQWRHQVRSREGAEALQPRQRLGGERVEVGHVVQHAQADEQLHPLFAQSLDVHGRPRAEVGDPLDPLGRAVEVGAERVALPRQPYERTATARARGGNFHARARRGRRPFLPLAAPAAEPPAAAAPAAAAPLPAAPSVDASPALPAPGPSTGPTTSGITSPALRTMTVSPGRTSLRATWSSLWRVASRHGGATDEHRLQHGERRGLPCARWTLDVVEPGGPFLGWELVGDGPSRGVGGGAELAPKGKSSTLITTPSIS